MPWKTVPNALHFEPQLTGSARSWTFANRDSAGRSEPRCLLAALRNVVIGLFRRAGATNVAAAIRACAWSAPRALRLIGVRVA